MKIFAVLLCALLVGCAPAPSISPQASAASSPSAPSQSASSPSAASPTPPEIFPTSPPTETVICVPETGPLPSALGDPCPSAIAVVRAVVEPLGQPIAQLYVEPGPFICGVVLWPGVGPPLDCSVLVLPGRTMHGWVSFSATDKVAAVTLYRSVPISRAIPSPVPPWTASLAAFIVPPAGWSMP